MSLPPPKHADGAAFFAPTVEQPDPADRATSSSVMAELRTLSPVLRAEAQLLTVLRRAGQVTHWTELAEIEVAVLALVKCFTPADKVLLQRRLALRAANDEIAALFGRLGPIRQYRVATALTS